MHEVADAQETELKSLVPMDLGVHEEPFHVESFCAVTSAQKLLVGHDSVPASESKDCD